MNLADALELGDRELVAFVGAGGKKTAMTHLVDVGGKRGLSVGYTTTTNMPPPEDLPLVVAAELDVRDALAEAASPVAFAGARVEDPNRADAKVSGHPPEAVSEVFASGRFDWLVVKADGARRREFKAPGPEEPVVPGTATHVVPVASALAMGEPLDAPAVHRPERVAAIADVAVGDRVTPEVVGRVLASDRGGLKGVPTGATATSIINKADTPQLRETAREAVRVALDASAAFDRGLVTSFETGYCEVII